MLFSFGLDLIWFQVSTKTKNKHSYLYTIIKKSKSLLGSSISTRRRSYCYATTVVCSSTIGMSDDESHFCRSTEYIYKHAMIKWCQSPYTINQRNDDGKSVCEICGTRRCGNIFLLSSDGKTIARSFSETKLTLNRSELLPESIAGRIEGGHLPPKLKWGIHFN